MHYIKKPNSFGYSTTTSLKLFTSTIHSLQTCQDYFRFSNEFSKLVGILSIKYFGGYHQADGSRGREDYRYLKSDGISDEINVAYICHRRKSRFSSTSGWLTWACCVLVWDSGGSTVETLDSSRKGFWVSGQSGLRATVFFSSSGGQRCSERLFFTYSLHGSLKYLIRPNATRCFQNSFE